jgi:protein SCO1
MNRQIAALLLLTLVAGGCSRPGTPSTAASSERRAATAQTTTTGPPDRVALIREEHLPNIRLITHEGREVRFYDDLVKGKVVAINFMYANCRGACLPSTAHLAEVQQSLGDRMGRDITFLSVSLDPEHDTPEVLRDYAKAHDVGPGWYFLTGKRDDIELLRHDLGAYELDPRVDADRTQHAGIVILGNEPKGRWKAISALSNPVRIRQAIERTILPPNLWGTGEAVVAEAPFEKSVASQMRVTPVDSSRIALLARELPDRGSSK